MFGSEIGMFALVGNGLLLFCMFPFVPDDLRVLDLDFLHLAQFTFDPSPTQTATEYRALLNDLATFLCMLRRKPAFGSVSSTVETGFLCQPRLLSACQHVS